jgi:sigma-B regulation protein RsbQ
VDVRAAFNVTESGDPRGRPMLFAHGFGCDQHMWRHVAPCFEDGYRVIRFDYAGSGGAGAAYDPDRYATLHGYAADVLAISHDLALRDLVFVGHSVSAMVGVLAEREAPELFGAHVMVGPSPRYVNDADYHGGFELSDIDGLLDSLASNYLGWSATMAPVIMANPDRPELGKELETSFCTVDPDVAQGFAKATFLSDNRADLPHVRARTLVLQSREDAIAPLEVGRYVAEHVPDGTLVVLDAVGHCPHMSAPAEVVHAMRQFLEASSPRGT